MEKNKVSIIICTYRHDDLLKKALTSIIYQSYTNLEIIVVDDNAENNWNNKVLKTVESYHDERIVYIKNIKNLGSAAARNVGIISSNGDYITFLDDDDVYFENKIEKQLNKMLAENSDYSISNLLLVDINDRVVGLRKREKILKYSSLFEYHLLHHLTGTDTMMFRSEYIKAIGMFGNMDIGDEFYLMAKAILNNGRFSHIDEILVKATVHPMGKGLTLGNKKIQGEDYLYSYKKTFFNKLKFTSRQYIKMRHYVVISRYYFKSGQILKSLFYLIISFISSPLGLLKMFIRGVQ